MALYEIFLEHYPPDEKGWTEIAYREDLIKLDPKFDTKNGCSWARSDATWLRPYNIKRFSAKELGGKGNKTVAFQLQGFKDVAKNRTIPIEVKKALKGKPCVVIGVVTNDMEIDHKNGKYDQESYTINDFQPMSKAVNDAKREHCKKCNSSGCRFKATVLGYPIDFYEGDENSPSCIGCYWYDPIAFKSSLIKGVT